MSHPPLPGTLCILVLLATATCRGGPPPATSIPPRADYADLAASLSATIERQMADKDIPGLSIALRDGDQVVWARGFGRARPDDHPAGGAPAGAGTVYRMASISKLITDTLAMQLVERGALDLDAPVTAYLPGFRPANPFGRPITLRHLMSHRSGLVREPPVGHYFDATSPGLVATVDSLNGTALVYAPGARLKYSNAGIAVIGRILERHHQQPFPDLADDRVLEPLSMTDSSFRRPAHLRPRRSVGTMWTHDGRDIDTPDFAFGFGPAADLESTVLDLLDFAHSWFPDSEVRLLSKESLERMWQVQAAPGDPAPSSGCGLGFFVGDLEGHRRVGHDGAAYGCASELAALPDQGLAVAVAVARDFAGDLARRIADDALRGALAVRAGRPAPEAPAPRGLAPDEAGPLAGRYGDGDYWVTLAIRDGEPFLQPSHGAGAPLRETGGALLTDGAVEMGSYRVTGGGWRDSDPRTLQVNGRELPRLPSTAPPPAPAEWQELLGEYGWDHNRLIVFEDNGRLCILIEWVLRYPLTRLGTLHYRLEDRGLYPGEQVMFERDGELRVHAVRVGGVRFPKVAIGPEAGVTFRIEPQHPPDRLRQLAAAASPPAQPDGLRAPDLRELRELDPSIRYDIRYASTDNFMGTVFYDRARAMLQRPAAEALVRAHEKLVAKGYGLLIHDAYRPWSVTRMFWDATPEHLREFVADPSRGSRHNRGCAVDLTLYHLGSGEPVAMVSGYDEFTPRAYPHYPGTTDRQRWHRELLRGAMEAEGFSVYEREWWHFDFEDWQRYPVQDTPL